MKANGVGGGFGGGGGSGNGKHPDDVAARHGIAGMSQGKARVEPDGCPFCLVGAIPASATAAATSKNPWGPQPGTLNLKLDGTGGSLHVPVDCVALLVGAGRGAIRALQAYTGCRVRIGTSAPCFMASVVIRNVGGRSDSIACKAAVAECAGLIEDVVSRKVSVQAAIGKVRSHQRGHASQVSIPEPSPDTEDQIVAQAGMAQVDILAQAVCLSRVFFPLWTKAITRLRYPPLSSVWE